MLYMFIIDILIRYQHETLHPTTICSSPQKPDCTRAIHTPTCILHQNLFFSFHCGRDSIFARGIRPISATGSYRSIPIHKELIIAASSPLSRIDLILIQFGETYNDTLYHKTETVKGYE
ncbi:unnamed protein product [Cuscuta europaea]|uniref:Uncharacterized protein n=1 Tax=Cuscuta europaea TaxID=41803 RepID=A0A9P0VSF8_CUSEU|nr:unnamed protein product [Cuscuta europaea]